MSNLPFLCIFLIVLLQLLSGTRIVLVSGQCLGDQRSLLIQFKNSIVFDRTVSSKLVTWNESEDCCTWKGVTCDGSGHVIGLELENETISGAIENSTSLFGFQYLEKLNLAFNRFDNHGIPKRIYNLASLTDLNLSNAGFVGQIPIELSTMTRLLTLDLSTQFAGFQPLRLENPNLTTLVQHLTELRELYLDGVNISAAGSEWGWALSSSLPNLRILSLANCHLYGPIDSSFSQLVHLSFIRLDNNNLSTASPDFFANFSKLTTLSLSSCSLQGFFPEKIFQVPTLQNLDLSNNKMLQGNLPQFPQGGSLLKIVLSQTKFSGSLPDSIGNLGILSSIDLSNCNFSGRIPSTMRKLTEIVYFDMSSNNFTGLLPLFNMSNKLTYIDLSRNGLTGSLSPKHFEGLNDLVFMNLGYNLFNGSIPPSLFALPSLQRLVLSNNQFGGQVESLSIPSSQLDTLDLSGNLLEGPIPKFFFELRKLNVLLLSFNSFNSTLQLQSIGNLQHLTRLELGHNNLSINASTGSSSSDFPNLTRLSLASCKLKKFPDLKNQSRMSFLDLSDNQIEGEIPKWIWEIGNGSLVHLNLSYNILQYMENPYKIPDTLSILDIHHNRIQGNLPNPPPSAIYIDYSTNNFNQSIPADIGKIVSFASFFSLASNNLTGAIPESICNASYLQVLDLSNNSLSGTIPSCLLSTPALGVLNLGRNSLSGTIPDAFSPSCALRTLDLSRNNLSGKIPSSLANCTFLEVISIGNNKIEDVFPCMFKTSSSLRVLVLRSNRFHGDLRCPPMSNNSWPNLQIIDIAANNFSGELFPQCLLTWTGMIKNGAQIERDHLRFDFLYLNKFYYQDTVTVTIKGLELELVKILTVFTSIDFSCNNFSGDIPETIGSLSSLYILNFSNNFLTGQIPKSIGKLTQLGSLDLSKNQLTGEVPVELTNLTFLSFLNLSYNKLVGEIPLVKQFLTFSAASYQGNAGLCGLPLKRGCEEKESAPNSAPILSTSDFHWRFIFTGLGFGVGAALIIAPLAFIKEWREQFGQYLDQLIKLIFPMYGFSYIRYDGKVTPAEEIDDETTDEDEEEEEEENDTFRGMYCVFCTKVDIERKKAVHNPKCTCHFSPPAFYYSPTSTSSSSSSLVVTYRQNSLCLS